MFFLTTTSSTLTAMFTKTHTPASHKCVYVCVCMGAYVCVRACVLACVCVHVCDTKMRNEKAAFYDIFYCKIIVV